MIQATHSMGYHFSQSSLGLMVDEVEFLMALEVELEDELEVGQAFDWDEFVVKEVLDEFKGSSTSSVESSFALFPRREKASLRTSASTSSSVFPEGMPSFIILVNKRPLVKIIQ